MFTFFMIKELILATPLILTLPLNSGQIGNQSKYTYYYNSNEMVWGSIPEPNTVLGTQIKEVYSYSMPENPTIVGNLNIKQKSYMSKETETHTINDNGIYKTDSIYTYVRNIIIIQYEVRENTETDSSDSYIHINYPQIPNELINATWELYKFGEQSLYNNINALFELREQTGQECYNSISELQETFTLQEDLLYSTTYNYLPATIPINIDTSLNEGDYAYFGITLECTLNRIYNPEDYPTGIPDTETVDLTQYFNFTQFPQYTYWDITYLFTVDETNYEVIDVTRLLLDLVVMPFTFISQAFNLTLFAGTMYSINVARIIFVIIATMLIIYIVRKFIL